MTHLVWRLNNTPELCLNLLHARLRLQGNNLAPPRLGFPGPLQPASNVISATISNTDDAPYITGYSCIMPNSAAGLQQS